MAYEKYNHERELIHPGFFLGMELKARGITQKNFAEQISLQQSHLSEVIRGKRNITNLLADKIENVLCIPAGHWIKMQAEYDYQTKLCNQKDACEREAEATLSEYNLIYDMRTIYNSVGIMNKSASERLSFCVNSLHFVSPAIQGRHVRGFFHRSEKTGLDARMIATWVVLAKYEISLCPNPCCSFKRDRMDNLSIELRDIFNENRNTLNRVQHKMSEYGIKFCIVPKVKHASIDGFSFFTKDDVPAIVVTKRYNRIDNLAFAIMHEIGHLKLHSMKLDMENINLALVEEELLTNKEKEANDYAANALIPNNIWDCMPSVTMNPHVIQKEFSKWAKIHCLNKWIVLGRVSHETGMYMFKSDKTREIN